MTDLTTAEKETHLNMTGDDHSAWEVFTDDPFWIRRLDKVADCTDQSGDGKFYRLDKGQVTIRKKRQLSAAQRAKLRERAATVLNSSNNSNSETQNGR